MFFMFHTLLSFVNFPYFFHKLILCPFSHSLMYFAYAPPPLLKNIYKLMELFSKSYFSPKVSA